MKKNYLVCSFIIISVIVISLLVNFKNQKAKYVAIQQYEVTAIPNIFDKYVTCEVVELENNTLGTYIKVMLKLNITQEDEYRIGGSLIKKDDSGKECSFFQDGYMNPPNILMARIPIDPLVKLEEGMHDISVYFWTDRLISGKVNGPYDFKLFIEGKETGIHEEISFKTKAYQYKEFKRVK